MPTYHAWSPIKSAVKTGENAAGNPVMKLINVQHGEEVSADKLGISEKDFQDLVNSGAVREFAPPELPENYQDSPINYMKEIVRRVEKAATSFEGGGVNAALLQKAFKGPLPDIPDNVDELNDTGAETKDDPNQHNVT